MSMVKDAEIKALSNVIDDEDAVIFATSNV